MIQRRLVVLALGAFVVASVGTLVVGLLRQIARGLRRRGGVLGAEVHGADADQRRELDHRDRADD